MQVPVLAPGKGIGQEVEGRFFRQPMHRQIRQPLGQHLFHGLVDDPTSPDILAARHRSPLPELVLFGTVGDDLLLHPHQFGIQTGRLDGIGAAGQYRPFPKPIRGRVAQHHLRILG
jgi:hypothetical protein